MPKLGRPPKPKEDKLSELLGVRVSRRTFKLLKARAIKNGTSPTTEARVILESTLQGEHGLPLWAEFLDERGMLERSRGGP